MESKGVNFLHGQQAESMDRMVEDAIQQLKEMQRLHVQKIRDLEAQVREKDEEKTQLLQQLETVRAERQRATTEAAEERTNAMEAEAQKAAEKITELEHLKDALQGQLTTMSAKLEKAEADSGSSASQRQLQESNCKYIELIDAAEAELLERSRQAATLRRGNEDLLKQVGSATQAVQELRERLADAEAKLESRSAELQALQIERQENRATIQDLESSVNSLKARAESQGGHREAELPGRSQEELLTKLRIVMVQSADEAKSLRAETAAAQASLQRAQEEQSQLRAALDQCLRRMEIEDQERPHLVDKRMVIQMVAAFLEQRNHPKQQQEIMRHMADLLGFTAQERKQVGLDSPRESPEALSDLFIKYLEEGAH